MDEDLIPFVYVNVVELKNVVHERRDDAILVIVAV